MMQKMRQGDYADLFLYFGKDLLKKILEQVSSTFCAWFLGKMFILLYSIN